MRHSHQSYSHRGDILRRRQRNRRVLLLAGFAVAAVFVTGQRMMQPAAAEPAREAAPGMFVGARELRRELDDARGQLELARAELDRAKRVMTFSSRYGIGADLAASIIDVSNAEGIDPELGFRLVKLESDFNERATSPVGAIGLTQVMPSTAKYFVRGATPRKLYDRETNLRVGFRYLRTLLGQYDGNVKLALLAYNRGPVAVEAARRQGINPSNGYDRIVTRGYKGKGTVD